MVHSVRNTVKTPNKWKMEMALALGCCVGDLSRIATSATVFSTAYLIAFLTLPTANLSSILNYSGLTESRRNLLPSYPKIFSFVCKNISFFKSKAHKSIKNDFTFYCTGMIRNEYPTYMPEVHETLHKVRLS